MTGALQKFLYTSEDFKEKSRKLAQSVEMNSAIVADSSTENSGQRNSILSKLCHQAAEARAAGKHMEAAMLALEKEMVSVKDRQYQRQKDLHLSRGQEKGDGR